MDWVFGRFHPSGPHGRRYRHLTETMTIVTAFHESDVRLCTVCQQVLRERESPIADRGGEEEE